MDKNINIKLSKEEFYIINRNIKSVQMKFRIISVFEFIKFEIIKNNGYWKVSIKKLNELYGNKYYKFSYTLMNKIVHELININLLKIEIKKNKKVFCLVEYN